VGGLRRRFGLVGLSGLGEGLAVAAPAALALAAGISAFAWWRLEPTVHTAQTLAGALRTTGPIAYLCWLLAALAWLAPGRTLRRVLAGAATVVTAALPVITPWTPVDHPPLWMMMALAAFGLITVVGAQAGQGPVDTRLAVPVAALGFALVTDAVTGAVTVGLASGTYDRAATARIGQVVTATVALLAVGAVARRIRGRAAAPWLWAAALLALPAGWLGRSGVGFDRLAQVVLATCAAVALLAWLVRRSSPRPAPTPVSLRLAGATALGTGLGLAAFGWAGPLVVPGRVTGGTQLLGPVAALLAAGVLAVAAGDGGWRRPVAAVTTTGGLTVAAAWVAGLAEYAWGWRDHADLARTGGLAAMVAILPLALCAYTAGRLLSRWRTGPRRWAGAGVLVAAGAWIGWAALPHLWLWAPAMVALTLCRMAEALPPSRRRAGG
jgi:hypothetical protein